MQVDFDVDAFDFRFIILDKKNMGVASAGLRARDAGTVANVNLGPLSYIVY